MRPASPDSFSLPGRLLALGGLAGLAALTLADRGATRMFAAPWTTVLAAVLASPVAALLLRAASAARPLRLPAGPWLGLAAAAAVLPLLSALASPFRGPSLLAAAVPVGAVAVFLLVHDWLAGEPVARGARLEQGFALAGALVATASAGLWLVDVAALPAHDLFSRAPFEIRNPHPLGHPNYTAGLMLLALPWLVRAAARTTGAARIAALAFALLAGLNLFTSGSRGGLLGLAVLGIAALAVAGLGWKRFLLCGAGAVVVAAGLAAAHPRIRALLRVPDPAAAPNESDVQRAAMRHAGALMGRDRPLLGWGPGSTPLAYPRYRHELDGGVENVLQLHNTPLQLWAETGAASVLVAAGLAGLAAFAWRRAPLAAATLAGYGALALTDYQLDVPFFAAAVAALLARLAPPAPAAAPRGLRLGLALGALAATAAIAGLGARDPAPPLNAEALALAPDPARHDRAVALLRESLALNPDQEIAHFNLGWLLLVSEPEAAEKHFLAAARLVPDKGGVYFGLALARLNQNRPDGAARALALECLNEPLFLASPWWTVPEIAAQRDATAAEFSRLARGEAAADGAGTWTQRQAARLAELAPRLGRVPPGPEKNYRRQRVGYPVLMRNLDLPPPADLYDVREDPRFPDTVPFPLPSKGWLPAPRLLKLLDAPALPP